MANPNLYNGVMATTTTTGTGTLALGSAVTGYQAVPSTADGLKVPYRAWAVNSVGNPTGDWEVGIGTYTHSGTTLARTEIIASSNSGSAVSFAAGTKRVAITLPVEMVAYPAAPIGGRLTTESGVPVSTSDRASQGTLYWTPHSSDYLRLYNGVRIKEYVCSQKSLSLSVSSGSNYDVWLYDNSGTVTLALSAAWASNTSRTDAIAFESGLGWVKSGDATRLHVGTIRASGSNVTEDSLSNRFVWNRYNQVQRALRRYETNTYWTYATDTIRQANGSGSNQFAYVTGDAASLVNARLTGVASGDNVGRGWKVGIGIDSTTAFSGTIGYGFNVVGGYSVGSTSTAEYIGYPGLGYHYIAWLEKGGDGNCYFHGTHDGGNAGLQAMLMG